MLHITYTIVLYLADGTTVLVCSFIFLHLYQQGSLGQA